VPLAGVSLRRHATRPQAAEFGPDDMRAWYQLRDLLTSIREHVIPETSAVRETTALILGETRLLQASTAAKYSNARLPQPSTAAAHIRCKLGDGVFAGTAASSERRGPWYEPTRLRPVTALAFNPWVQGFEPSSRVLSPPDPS